MHHDLTLKVLFHGLPVRLLEFLTGRRPEGRVEGAHLFLSKQLERRFGPLPDGVMARLRAADAATLERWGMRLITAHSLDEVLVDE